jgi:hypothetical protein
MQSDGHYWSGSWRSRQFSASTPRPAHQNPQIRFYSPFQAWGDLRRRQNYFVAGDELKTSWSRVKSSMASWSRALP